MEHQGHRERIRERFRQTKMKDFAPHEVLELLLTFAIPRADVNPLAHRLLDHFGSLPAVLEASEAELLTVDGIGPQAATLITMMLPVFQHYEQEKNKPALRVNRFQELTEYCSALYLGTGVEQLYVLSFDSRMKLLATDLIGTGTPMEVAVTPRQVVQAAIRRNAAGAVLTHNHPSGETEPSPEDVRVTKAIQMALDSVGIVLYDHLIVSRPHVYSFYQHGLLKLPQTNEQEMEEYRAAEVNRQPKNI